MLIIKIYIIFGQILGKRILNVMAEFSGKKEFFISLVLDKRRKSNQKLYPVKIMVYSRIERKNKRYSTGYEFSESDFERIWLSEKPRTEFQAIRDNLDSLLVRTKQIAETIKPFDFKKFERKFLRKTGDNLNVFQHYNEAIAEMFEKKQYSTAVLYQASIKSFERFSNTNENLSFSKITGETGEIDHFRPVQTDHFWPV